MDWLRAIQEMYSVFERQWFKRVWIIQELAVSGEVVLVCGSYMIRWVVVDRTYAISSNRWDEDDYLANLIEQRRRYLLSVPATLADKILAAYSAEATNVKDRIYSVVGLVPEATAGMIPINVDYDGRCCGAVQRYYREEMPGSERRCEHSFDLLRG